MLEYPIAIGGYQLYIHTVLKEISGYDYDKHYVGITRGTMKNRWHGGAGYYGQVFGNAIQKYGADNIQHFVMYESLTYYDANILEQLMIRALHSHTNERGYNVSMGGQGTSGSQPSSQRDISGMRFGKLIAKNRIGSIHNRGHIRSLWYCKCDCGNDTTVLLDNLLRYINTNGERGTGSCGCMSARNFGTPKPNQFDFYDDYVVGHCNNGSSFIIDIQDYEKIKHRTWTTLKKTGYIIANETQKYERCRIESIILDVPTYNVDKLRLKFKNGNCSDVRKSNMIIYSPNCDNKYEYNYYIHNIVAKGLRFDHGDIWSVGKKGDKRHSVHGFEQALLEYEERYGEDLLTDYLKYKEEVITNEQQPFS